MLGAPSSMEKSCASSPISWRHARYRSEWAVESRNPRHGMAPRSCFLPPPGKPLVDARARCQASCFQRRERGGRSRCGAATRGRGRRRGASRRRSAREALPTADAPLATGFALLGAVGWCVRHHCTAGMRRADAARWSVADCGAGTDRRSVAAGGAGTDGRSVAAGRAGADGRSVAAGGTGTAVENGILMGGRGAELARRWDAGGEKIGDFREVGFGRRELGGHRLRQLG